MSKPESGLFDGTSGIDDFYGNAETIIASRVKGLDLTPHPIQQKQLSAKKKKAIKDKIEKRQATREEYRLLNWDKRLKTRRQDGVDSFWDQERERIIANHQTTRAWTDEQKKSIINGEKPKFNDKVIEAHHSYCVSQYPHLSNKGEIIYPATHDEHLKGWHGGNYRRSQPGRRIRRIREF